MRYLGRIAGAGSLLRDGETLARATFDFEGFSGPRGAIVSSGELLLAPSVLKSILGVPGVQLLSDDGRLLDLKFSQKETRWAAGVAHVDVSGNLPGTAEEWRAGSYKTPAQAES